MTQRKVPHLYYKCRKCGAFIVGEKANPRLGAIEIALIVGKDYIMLHDCGGGGKGIADLVGTIDEYTPEKESEV